MDAQLENEIRSAIENPDMLFHGGMGMHLVTLKEGYAEAEVVLEKRHGNPHGTIHGGLILTLADNTCGAACATYGVRVVTVSSSLNFLRANPNAKRLIARAEVIKKGRWIYVTEGRLYDEDDLLLATGLFEYAVVD